MNIKKPKFWDLKKPNLISYLLTPFTLPLIVNNFFLNKKKKLMVSKVYVLEIYMLVVLEKQQPQLNYMKF